ncbi:hypothetical protein Baya_15199 [Bagarius yarrelli]|uniref:Uncharacterized protein n=1 Tax=Bagarius yarrelli TaxID=175774 RepID=A0A556VB33_BAGYA|nr:hypothetical protein Baya_15199 [Bagarius yarrelli]
METGAERRTCESLSEYTYVGDAAERPAAARNFPVYPLDEEVLHTDPTKHPKVKDHIHNRETVLEPEPEPPDGRRRSALQGRMTHVQVANADTGDGQGALS